MVASASLVDRTIELVRADAWRMECLQAVCSLRLPDWYAAAGFLRNAIWDALHDKPDRTPLNDIDVVYYDSGIPLQVAEDQEVEIEAALRRLLPERPWSHF